MHHPMPAALPYRVVRDVSREMDSRVGVHMVPIEGVKQGIGGGEVVVWEISPSVRLGQRRWVWCQILVLGVDLARRDVVVVGRPGVTLGAVLMGCPGCIRLWSFDRTGGAG